MRKNTLIALLLVLTWQVNAQELSPTVVFSGTEARKAERFEPSEFGIKKRPEFERHEIKLDVAYLITGTIKVEYEHLFNNWSSAGLVAFHSLPDPREAIFRINGDHRTQVLGFFRLYFGKEPTTGFFAEGNFGITSGDYYEKYTAFGTGLAVGRKWHIPESGIVLDLFVGMGRLFRDSRGRRGYYTTNYPRLGFCIGKRF